MALPLKRVPVRMLQFVARKRLMDLEAVPFWKRIVRSLVIDAIARTAGEDSDSNPPRFRN